MLPDDDEILALSDRFFAALERGDIETIKECYTSDVRVWHNIDQAEKTASEHLKGLQKFFLGLYSNRRYTDVRYHRFSGGFVRQHVLTASLADGARIALAICVVCLVEHGRIKRLDEYLGPTSVLLQDERHGARDAQ